MLSEQLGQALRVSDWGGRRLSVLAVASRGVQAHGRSMAIGLLAGNLANQLQGATRLIAAVRLLGGHHVACVLGGVFEMDGDWQNIHAIIIGFSSEKIALRHSPTFRASLRRIVTWNGGKRSANIFRFGKWNRQGNRPAVWALQATEVEIHKCILNRGPLRKDQKGNKKRFSDSILEHL